MMTDASWFPPTRVKNMLTVSPVNVAPNCTLKDSKRDRKKSKKTSASAAKQTKNKKKKRLGWNKKQQ